MRQKSQMRIPDVDVKFKIYRLSRFDKRRGLSLRFYAHDGLGQESLSLIAKSEVPDFRNHFWPKVELMNMCPDQDDLEFDNSNYYPKHKIDRKAEGDQVHRATITMKVRRLLFCRLDYREFPFDNQVLELTVKMLSVRMPILSTKSGVRPTVRHPTRWRGWKKGKKFGHELTLIRLVTGIEFIRLAADATEQIWPFSQQR